VIKDVRIEIDPDGIGELLRSPEVRADLERRATAVAKAAQDRGILVDGEPGKEALPIITGSGTGGGRARAFVRILHPSGLAVEAKHRLLVGSLDAAGS
jgi:hypothetical protein